MNPIFITMTGREPENHLNWSAFKRLARDFSATEQAGLFHNTAARAYRMPEV